jgi:hypothetical protein
MKTASALARRWPSGPLTMPLLLLTSLAVTGCDRSPGKQDIPSRTAKAFAACMKDLPGDPVKTAQADVARGVVQLYSYWRNGVGAGPGTPGVQNCPSREPRKGAAAVLDHDFPISIDEEKTTEQDAHMDDAPEVLDTCGLRQERYMRTYNLEVARLRPPPIVAQCRYIILDPGPFTQQE